MLVTQMAIAVVSVSTATFHCTNLMWAQDAVHPLSRATEMVHSIAYFLRDLLSFAVGTINTLAFSPPDRIEDKSLILSTL